MYAFGVIDGIYLYKSRLQITIYDAKYCTSLICFISNKQFSREIKVKQTHWVNRKRSNYPRYIHQGNTVVLILEK